MLFCVLCVLLCAVVCCVVVLLCVIVCVMSCVCLCVTLPKMLAMRSMNLRVRYLGNASGARGNNTAHPVYYV